MYNQIQGCGNEFLDSVHQQEQRQKHKTRVRKVSPHSSILESIEAKPHSLNPSKTIHLAEEKLQEIEHRNRMLFAKMKKID